MYGCSIRIKTSNYANDKAHKRDNIRNDHSPNFRIIAAAKPCQQQERHNTHKSCNEGNRLKSRLPRCEHKKCTQQAEQDCPMAHKNNEVRILNRNAVECRKPLTTKDSGEWQQMNNAHDNEHCRDKITHYLMRKSEMKTMNLKQQLTKILVEKFLQ